jgi:putative ABC transport system permease protein
VAGLYGVVSYGVARRAREIGIRMALGARAQEVIAMVLGRGMRLVLIGVVAGLLGAFGLSRLLSGFLYGIRATDALTFAGVALIIAFVSALASWLPARRAATVDPLQVLRTD